MTKLFSLFTVALDNDNENEVPHVILSTYIVRAAGVQDALKRISTRRRVQDATEVWAAQFIVGESGVVCDHEDKLTERVHLGDFERWAKGSEVYIRLLARSPSLQDQADARLAAYFSKHYPVHA